jgi:hypothetical protein
MSKRTILWLVLSAHLAHGELSHAQAAAEPKALDDEAVYQQRFDRLQNAARLGLGLESYEPLEKVAGARRVRPLPVARAAEVRIAALIGRLRAF